jgi:hypothetical protein
MECVRVNDGQFRVGFARSFRDFPPIDLAGQFDVRHQGIEVFSTAMAHRFLAVRRFEDQKPASARVPAAISPINISSSMTSTFSDIANALGDYG